MWHSFSKRIILIPHNLAVSLLHLYSREILVACRRHSYVHRNTVYYSQKWKQFINPSTGEYINYDTYHICTVAQYIPMKIYELQQYATIWTNLRSIILSGKKTCIRKLHAAAAKSLQSCPTLCRRQPTRLPRPCDSPGKNTGVHCHFLLQCMKVKSESEATQSCPTLRDPMDCSPPGSSVHGIFQARVLEWGAIAFSESNTGPI